MIIHFFTRGDIRSADSRQRAFLIADKLNTRGIAATIETPPVFLFSLTPWPQKSLLLVELLRSLSHIKKEDIVYLQRTLSNKYFFIIMVMYLALFRRKMIFDFCDPVYVVNPFKTRVFTRMAKAVIVSSHLQAEWAKRHNANVHLIHISLDTSVYERYSKDYSIPADVPVIGWVGTAHNHLLNLGILAEAFRLLTQTGRRFTFTLVGAFENKKVYDLFRNVPGLDAHFIDRLEYVDPESVPREIQKFDIGVVPQINDTDWNRGKTSMKILEYMACGIVTVASASGELPYIIENGVDGYLAGSATEWAEKLGRLLDDRRLCARLGAAGQKVVREHYSFDAVVPRIEKVLRAVTF